VLSTPFFLCQGRAVPGLSAPPDRLGLYRHREVDRGKTSLRSQPFRSTKFPLAEGMSIFVGILAWDLLSEGHLSLLKALLIAVPCALVWYAVRCWRRCVKK
jgi:hypothetical protein